MDVQIQENKENKGNKVLINDTIYFNSFQYTSTMSCFSKPVYLKEVSDFALGKTDLNFKIVIGTKVFEFNFSKHQQQTFLNNSYNGLSKIKYFIVFERGTKKGIEKGIEKGTDLQYLCRLFVHPLTKIIFKIQCHLLKPIERN